jgi:hypothetical protein
MRAEGKKPPVEFVEKKLHSYCKFQAEEANNKKCARCRTASSVASLPHPHGLRRPVLQPVDMRRY